MDADRAAEELRSLLIEAVSRDPAEGILLSGGLDTSVVAAVACRFGKPKAVTVALADAPAPDLECSKKVAEHLGLEHRIHVFGRREVEEAMAHVVKTMRTFDPMEVRNSAAITVGLRIAREQGIQTVFTGDASDELLAGYSFYHHLREQELKEALGKMWKVMRFSSVPLARSLGLEAKLPYLEPGFKEFAMCLDPDLLVREVGGTIYGKWILRYAFRDELPEEIIWRVKTPIEYGCGTTILPKLYESWIDDAEFLKEKDEIYNSDRVIIRDKEHLAYYRIFRRTFGPPAPRDADGKICPQCHSNVEHYNNFCITCGAYPV